MNNPTTLYGKYILERENKYILEKEYGFATYKIEPEYIYIEDIYVLPELRKSDKAAKMADEIVEIAKKQGKTHIIGSVDMNANGATTSLKVLLGYGFSLLQSTETMIYFKKEIL
jgi:predicted GNAT family acetyltransferase